MKTSFISRSIIQEMLRRAKDYEISPESRFYVKGLTLLLEVSVHDHSCGGPSDVPMRVNWTFIGGLIQDLLDAARTPRRRDKKHVSMLNDLKEFYAHGESKVRETV